MIAIVAAVFWSLHSALLSLGTPLEMGHAITNVQVVPITSSKKPGMAAEIVGHILVPSLYCAERQMRGLPCSLLAPVLAKTKATLLLSLQLIPKGNGILKSPCTAIQVWAFACLALIVGNSLQCCMGQDCF